MKTSKGLTILRTLMTKGRTLLLIVGIALCLSISGCTTLAAEPPICLPDRPVLENISVQDQKLILEIDPKLLQQIGVNDLSLKNNRDLLEDLIRLHDEPLGSCD